MHPIERLRYVARAGSAPDRILVAESVPAFAAFVDSPGALLISLRQLIARQPESPGLVVLGARMLSALDPIDTAWAFVDELESERTEYVADELAINEAGGIEIIETLASSTGLLLCPPGADSWIAEARQLGRSVAAITPLGSRLPTLLWDGFIQRSTAGNVGAPLELIETDRVDELVGPDGIYDRASWSADCTDVVELARF